MSLFTGEAIFVLARRLMPGLRKMLIPAPAPAAVGHKDALSRRGQISDRLAGLLLKYQRADRYLQNQVFAGMPRAIRAFAVTPALGPEFAIVAVAQQRVVVGIRFQIHAASIAAIAARRPAARNVFLAAKRHAAVAAVPGLHINSGFINKHWKELQTDRRSTHPLKKDNISHFAKRLPRTEASPRCFACSKRVFLLSSCSLRSVQPC